MAKLIDSGSAARGELSVALADVRRAAHAREDPLANVARQMQDQVADSVLVLAASVPHLAVIETSEAIVDARGEFVQTTGGAIEKDAVERGLHA
jgi:hypothetical protein